MVPKPFARVVYAIGAPLTVPPGTPVDGLEEFRRAMEDATNSLMEQSKAVLAQRGSH
jgi:lysophospholipid acyltransferase (LPLAT)-like uncharacterized protein